MRFPLNCLYIRSERKFHFLEDFADKEFFYGCLSCVYAQRGGVWKEN